LTGADGGVLCGGIVLFLMEFEVLRSPDVDSVKQKVKRRMAKNKFKSSVDYDDMRHEEFVKAYRRVVKMREIADEAGIGFAAFFKGPAGSLICISNVYE
jgi:hypothetical protein